MEWQATHSRRLCRKPIWFLLCWPIYFLPCDQTDVIASQWAARQLLCCPLYADFTDPDLAGGVDDGRPGIVRQGNTVFRTIGTLRSFRLAGNQHLVDAVDRLGILEISDVARDFAIEEIVGVDTPGINVD